MVLNKELIALILGKSAMNDTNHIEVLQELQLSYLRGTAFNRVLIEVSAALEAAITALSARASAGEGGEGSGFGYYADRRWRESHYTAAPQPAQAGASGGGGDRVEWLIDTMPRIHPDSMTHDEAGSLWVWAQDVLGYLRSSQESRINYFSAQDAAARYGLNYNQFCAALEQYCGSTAPASPATGQGEPVAWMDHLGGVITAAMKKRDPGRPYDIPLHPPQPAAPQPQESEFFPIPAGLHPHTVNLVARFAAALADKLAKAERKYGYSDGWADADWMDECRAKLMEHVAKGDPRDVAAYCAFLWHHNERTAPTPPAHGDGEGE